MKSIVRLPICLLLLTISFGAPSALAVNKALSLDGDGDYVEVPKSDKFDLTEFTVELWFKPTSINGTRAVLGHGESFDTDKAQYVIEINNDPNPNKIQLWYEADDDSDTYVSSTTDIKPETWYFFAGTRDNMGGYQYLYQRRT